MVSEHAVNLLARLSSKCCRIIDSMHQKLTFLRNPRHPARSTPRSPTGKHARPKWGSPEKERRQWHAKVGVLQLCWLLDACQEADCGRSAVWPAQLS